MTDPGLHATPGRPVGGKKSAARRRHILRATIGYAVLAALWILLSDALLASALEPAAIQRLSTVKGLFFVIVTTLLLFFALQTTPDRAGATLDSPKITVPATAAPWSGFWSYGFAVGATLATLLVRFAIPGSFAERPMMVLFMFPIIISAMAGGVGPGLVATLTAALAVDYFTSAPLYSLRISKPIDLFHWSFLVADGVLVSILSEVLHRLRRQTEASRQLQAVTLASIGDGVITTDHGGRVTFLNPEAERLTGWRGGEALGRPLAEVFRVINEQTRQPVADPVQLVLASGEVMGLDSQALLLTRDSREVPIHDSGAPIRLANGTLLGGVLVFRDDTRGGRRKPWSWRNGRFIRIWSMPSRPASIGSWSAPAGPGAVIPPQAPRRSPSVLRRPATASARSSGSAAGNWPRIPAWSGAGSTPTTPPASPAPTPRPTWG